MELNNNNINNNDNNDVHVTALSVGIEVPFCEDGNARATVWDTNNENNDDNDDNNNNNNNNNNNKEMENTLHRASSSSFVSLSQSERPPSISELMQRSTNGWNAPSLIKWIEIPFRVAPPTKNKILNSNERNACAGVPSSNASLASSVSASSKRTVVLTEATGWAMDSAGRGPLNQVGSYVGAAILRLATAHVGCKNPRTCDERVGLFQPSSLLTATTAIMGVLAAVLMPVLGSIVDHTKHRKLVGILSGFGAVAAVGIQIGLNENNWFGMLVVDALQSFFLLVHATAVFAYLPDLVAHKNTTKRIQQQQKKTATTTNLSSNEQSQQQLEPQELSNVEIMGHYTAQFNVRQYSAQFVYVSLLILTGQVRERRRDDDEAVSALDQTLQTAHDAAGIAVAFGFLFITYAWTFLFRARPALSTVPPGTTLFGAGFVQVGRTAQKIFRDYRALKWFMISLLWSPEAGAGVILSIAVTFFTVGLRFTGQEIAYGNLLLMVGNIVGSYVSKFVCKWINPLRSYRLALTLLSVMIAVAVVVLDSPDEKGAAYGFSFGWGVLMGWIYPSQRVLQTTLIPRGQETEMMGLFTFVGQILGWLPALVSTILNENGFDIRWGLGIIPIFCMTAVACTLPMGSYDEAVELVQQDSDQKMNSIINSQSLAFQQNPANDSNDNDNMSKSWQRKQHLTSGVDSISCHDVEAARENIKEQQQEEANSCETAITSAPPGASSSSGFKL